MKDEIDKMVEERRLYKDFRGNSCSLETLCRSEPEWAASEIRKLRAAARAAFSALYHEVANACLCCGNEAGMDDGCPACVAIAELTPFAHDLIRVAYVRNIFEGPA